MTSAKPFTRRVEREDVLLWLFIGTPVFAFGAAQLGSFLMTRSICATGHRWVLYLLMAPALVATAATGVASWMKWSALASKESTDSTAIYRPFMAMVGVLLAAICVVAIFSLMIPAALDRLCN